MKLQVLVFLAIAIVLCCIPMYATKQFKDGVYKGESRSKYTSEAFWGKVTLKIKNDEVILLDFKILDKEKNEVFGPKYERHFQFTPYYIKQCRQELKGIKAYTKAFLKTKSMKQVDAITGATWSYDIFRDALNAALEKARIK